MRPLLLLATLLATVIGLEVPLGNHLSRRDIGAGKCFINSIFFIFDLHLLNKYKNMKKTMMVMVSQMPLITTTIMMAFQITLTMMMTMTVFQMTKKTKTVTVSSISLIMMMTMMAFQTIWKTKTLMVMELLMLLVSLNLAC